MYFTELKNSLGGFGPGVKIPSYIPQHQ